MKKVSVFTVLTCFLAGAAHFPCYAGNLFGKEEQPDDRSKKLAPQPSRSGGQPLPKTDKPVVDDPSKRLPAQPKQSPVGGVPPAYPKSNSSPFDPVITDPNDLDPELIDRAPADFLAASERSPQQSAEQTPTVEELVNGLHRAVPGLIVHIHMPGAAPQQLPSSSVPSSAPTPHPILPAPIPVQIPGDYGALPGVPVSHAHPLSQLTMPSPAAVPHEPPHELQSSVPSSSKEVKKFTSVSAFSYGGWSLMVPSDLRLVTHRNKVSTSVPEICSVHVFHSFDKVNDPQCRMVDEKCKPLSLDGKNDTLRIMKEYLDFYVEEEKNSEFRDLVTNLFSCLEKAVNLAEQVATFKVGINKGKKEVLFNMYIQGGPVLFCKISKEVK
jgi:hypothetical protein